MPKYKIKSGVKFRPYGPTSEITNANLTDIMAEMFISKNPKLLGVIFEKTDEQVIEVNEKPAPKKRGRKKKVII